MKPLDSDMKSDTPGYHDRTKQTDFMALDTIPATDHQPRYQRRILAANLAAALMVVVAIAAVPTGSRVVVIAPPWSKPDRVISIIADAGGTLVNGGRVSWLAVADGTSPDFINRLFAAGAMLVLDGRLAAACISGVST
ncbi:MAG: hypothetical protein Kow0026_28700 [Oricola sp.]